MREKLYILLICALTVSCSGRGRGESEGELSRLQFSAETNPVEVMVLRPVIFNKELVGNGKALARSKSDIGFNTGGSIEKINVKNGDYVKAGDVIAILDTEDAVNSYKLAKQSFERSKIDLNDAIIGFGYLAGDTTVTDEVLAISKIRSGYNNSEIALENAESVLAGCTLRAPFSGKIANIKKNLYEKAAEDFCTVIDDSYLLVEFKVFESELGMVSPGQEVRIASFFDPEKWASGRISSINPTVDEKGQVLIKAELRNSIGFIDGMNVKVFAQKAVPDQLCVPKSAVVIRDNLEVLFRYSGGRALWTYVHILEENSHSYVVTANTSRGADLNPGDSIIISGNLNLAHDSVVKLAEK